MKFADVKLGDALILQSGRYEDPDYYRVTVTKVTKTRFTTSGQNDSRSTQEWTKNGDEYPRQRDVWSFHHMQLHVPSEELSATITHSNAMRSAKKRLRLLGDRIQKFYRGDAVRQLSLKELGEINMALGDLDNLLIRHLTKEKPQE